MSSRAASADNMADTIHFDENGGQEEAESYSLGEVEPTWFFQDPIARSWRPLNPVDQQRTEAAYQANVRTVPIENGRYVLDVRRRRMRPQFWKFRSERVLRATWFVGVSDSTVEPCEVRAAAGPTAGPRRRAPAAGRRRTRSGSS